MSQYKIHAPMACTVVEVAVHAGETVRAGATLVVVEAMKMEHEIRAESDARVQGEELAKATKKSSLQTLTSPVDGTVSQLVVHTVGGVVEATKPIMIVVPAGVDGATSFDVQVCMAAGPGTSAGLTATPANPFATIDWSAAQPQGDDIETFADDQAA